jgi:hypothetical protein
LIALSCTFAAFITTTSIVGTSPVSGANSGPGIEENQSHRPPREPRPSMTSTRQVIRRGQNLQNNTSNQNQQILNALANLGHGALAH